MEHLSPRADAPILIVEAPVRHGKSHYMGEALVSWYALSHPGKQILYASATDRLAGRWSRRARNVVEEYGPEFFGAGLSPDVRATNNWQTTEGAGVLSAGVGGDVMGMDCHLGVVDDFLRNAEDALSLTIRDKQWEWFLSTMFTRLEPGGKIIVMGARWHPDDLIGRITGESTNVDAPLPHTRLTLPAIAEDADPMGRRPGEPLWRAKWPLGEPDRMVINDFGEQTVGLLMKKAMTTEYWWSAVHQQKPGRHDATSWPDRYFTGILCEGLPAHATASIVAIDTAEGQRLGKGCNSAIVGLIYSDGRLWASPLIARQPPEVTIKRAIQHALAIGSRHIVIEAQWLGSLVSTAFERELMAAGAPHIEVTVTRNSVPKPSRINRLGDYFARDQLRIVDTPDGRTLLEEAKNYPNGMVDGLDALEMAVRFLPEVAQRATVLKRGSEVTP